MKNILTILLLLGFAGLLAYFTTGQDGIEALLSREELEDDDEDELQTRQRLIEGTLSVSLSKQTQIQAGIETIQAEEIQLDAEERAFARVIDVSGLLDLRAGARTALAQKQIIETVSRNSKELLDQLTILHKEAGNISSSQLQSARAKWQEEQARVKAVDAELESIRNRMLQQWGSELTVLALDPGAELFDRLLTRQDVLLMLSLKTGQQLSESENFVLINRSDKRVEARKAWFISDAPLTDSTLQGETHIFRTSAEGLRIGMQIFAWLPGTGFSGKGIRIPRESVIWYAGQAWAYLQVDDGLFARRNLIDAVQFQDSWLVQENFQAGEKIVVSGAQTLLSEEFKYAIPDEDDD